MGPVPSGWRISIPDRLLMFSSRSLSVRVEASLRHLIGDASRCRQANAQAYSSHEKRPAGPVGVSDGEVVARPSALGSRPAAGGAQTSSSWRGPNVCSWRKVEIAGIIAQVELAGRSHFSHMTHAQRLAPLDPYQCASPSIPTSSIWPAVLSDFLRILGSPAWFGCVKHWKPVRFTASIQSQC